MKKCTLSVCLCLLLIFGCYSVKVNRGVDTDNVYYSDEHPSVKIEIDKRFAYSPRHPIAKNHKCGFFLDEQTKGSVFIRTYHDNYAPEESFRRKNMVSIEKQKILGRVFYVGTEIFKDYSGYYLKRVHLNYPDNSTMLVVMHTRPLSFYSDQYDWSKISSLTNKQKEIIDNFVNDNIKYVKFIK